MAQTAIDITGASDRSLVDGFIRAETGSLLAVSAFPLDAGTDPADNWCEVGIMSDGTEPQHRIVLLSAGYLGTAAPIGWTGNIPLEKAMNIYIHLYSSAATLTRLSVLVER